MKEIRLVEAVVSSFNFGYESVEQFVKLQLVWSGSQDFEQSAW